MFQPLTNVRVDIKTQGTRTQLRNANPIVVSRNTEIISADCLNAASSKHQNDINELKKVGKYPELIDKISEQILRSTTPNFSNLQNMPVCVVIFYHTSFHVIS